MTQKPPSLSALTKSEDPLSEITILVKQLLAQKSESRHLEWKAHPPLGPNVSTRSKYRMVKAAISFANWEGGFIIFGVDPSGKWVGLSKEDLRHVDPAKITELINGCVFPDIPILNYVEFSHQANQFAILHVPPSESLPHVTTKELLEKDDEGKVKTILAKHSLYCRQGSKSDIATPQQYQKIMSKKAEAVRDELLRRVREVPIPVAVKASGSGVTSTLNVARVTGEKGMKEAPIITFTRGQGGSSAIYMHEELSDGLFDEINNVVDANILLSKGRKAFVFGESIYYRIYAERQHITAVEKIACLARTGMHDFYAPMLFWFLLLPIESLTQLFLEAARDCQVPQVYGVMRMAILLGATLTDWFDDELQKKWKKHPQPPNYFWTYSEMRKLSTSNRILAALRHRPSEKIEIPNENNPVAIKSVMDKPASVVSLLNRSCMAVYEDRTEFRKTCRLLDIIAYGTEFESKGSEVYKLLCKST